MSHDLLVAVLGSRTCHQDHGRGFFSMLRHRKRPCQIQPGGTIRNDHLPDAVWEGRPGLLRPVQRKLFLEMFQNQGKRKYRLTPGSVKGGRIAGDPALECSAYFPNVDENGILFDLYFTGGNTAYSLIGTVEGNNHAIGFVEPYVHYDSEFHSLNFQRS